MREKRAVLTNTTEMSNLDRFVNHRQVSQRYEIYKSVWQISEKRQILCQDVTGVGIM